MTQAAIDKLPSNMRLKLRPLAVAPRDGRQVQALMDENGRQVFREIYFETNPQLIGFEGWKRQDIQHPIDESDYVIGWRHCAE